MLLSLLVVFSCPFSGVTDGKGQTATHDYDPLDRVTATTYAPGGPAFGYSYDADGAPRTLTDPGGTTTYTFDDLLRLKREDFPAGEGSVAYDYDAASNLKTLTDAGGTTTYAYDGLNELSSVTEPGDTSSTTFGYNSDGARTLIRYPSGVTVNTSYDVLSGRVKGVSNKAPFGSVLKSFSYDYKLGTLDTELPQKVTDQANNVTTNIYDALDRLIEATTLGPSPTHFKYVLDGNGNRLSITYNRTGSTGGTTETYAYDSASLPCWRALGTPASICGSPPSPPNIVYYTHDANGSDLYNTHQGYTYNAANQATSVYVRALDQTSGLAFRGDGQTQPIRDGSYTVQSNQLGIGVRASGSTAAAASTSSTTSRSSTASAEDDDSSSSGRLRAKPPAPSSGSPCESSTSSSLSPLAAAATATSYYARATDGTVLSQRTPSTSQRRNYLFDGEGSVVGLTDSSGALQTSYRYEPYGHPANFSSLGDPNPFGFLGSYSAGLESAGVICGGPNISGDGFYDAEDGRHTQRGNLALTSNNCSPLRWLDPFGDRGCGEDPSTLQRITSGIAGVAVGGVGLGILGVGVGHTADCIETSKGAALYACLKILSATGTIGGGALGVSGKLLNRAFGGLHRSFYGDLSKCGNSGVHCTS